jgi:diguanylate cyclase (GGDEF)-like protein
MRKTRAPQRKPRATQPLRRSVRDEAASRKDAEALRTGQNHILEMMAVGAPLPEVLTSLVHLVESESHGMLCSVLLLDESGKHLRHGAAPSLPEAYIKAIDGAAIGPLAGSCGTAAHLAKAVVVTDIQKDPLWAQYRHLAEPYSLRACWSTPITSSRERKVLGTFAMYYREVRNPTSDETRLIEFAVHMAGIAIEHKRTEDRIRHLSHHDPLTGLPNRALFEDRVTQAIAQVRRSHAKLAVLFVDLDGFKDINDSLGHQAGDRLLRVVGHRLQRCLRSGDTVARLGGDEFAISLPALSDNSDAVLVADKVQLALREPFSVSGRQLHVSSSIGVSVYPVDGRDAFALMRAADTALYHAKERGRDNYQFFMPALNEAAQQRLSILNRLHTALDREEFVLHYQPLIDLTTGRAGAVEALVRWRQPDGGLMFPGQFIKAAEDGGLIVALGEWVLRAACGQLKQWRDAGQSALCMSVNLSPRQLQRPGFHELVRGVLRDTGLPPEALQLEITESSIMLESHENLATLEQLATMGVTLAVDDFGTGYSSLAYLKRLPIRTLKIDRSFVSGIGDDPNDTAIVAAIISMAHSLGLKVVAEGVETAAQEAFLKAHGCLAVQGYYYSRPVPPETFALGLLAKPAGSVSD